MAGPGTLTIAAGQTLTATGDVTVTKVINNGTLAVGGALAARVSGNGGLWFPSGSTLVLQYDTSLGALTGVATLIVEPGVTLTVTGSMDVPTVNNSGTLVFDSADNIAATADISGTGTLQKLGTGTTTLAGAYTATGPLDLETGNYKFPGMDVRHEMRRAA